ncbi:phosphotransferase family protein [Roseisolibacter agri]|uniref:Aminoglycoside phosphotransferase domain-containing protein n=1 Tax=Roseisolibacter agri TaxID=2014610 RepID=A0AA37QBB8_9BACT|nr:phosphotransferase [Roseisolibacter agri]GLC23523.1 hypothetical protein rosag_00360 [Roseisolibacter agri]
MDAITDARWPRTYADAAARVRPHVPADAALEPIGQGDHSLAFRCGATVVRVARSSEAADALQREACTMARIADQLPVAVPRPTFARPGDRCAFSVHDEVTGVVLTRGRWLRLRAAKRERAAAELAGFLAALHELPVAVVRRCGLPVLTRAAYARRLREASGRGLHALLAADVRERLDATLAAWARDEDDAASVVLHRDLSPDHVLHDPASGRITGILDFGDLAIGDPARDLIFLREDHGEEMLDAVLRRYPHGRPAVLAPRVRAWGLLEALAWTLGHHAARRRAAVQQGLAAIAGALDDVLAPPARGA